MVSLFRIIKQATISVPATRYAVGVAGLIAVVALIVSFNIDFRIALWGVLVLLILMVLLAVFARLTQIASEAFRLPAQILMWSMVILFIGVCLLLTTSIFFKKPLDLQFVLLGSGTKENQTEKPNTYNSQKADSNLNKKPIAIQNSKDDTPLLHIHLASTLSDRRYKDLDEFQTDLQPLTHKYKIAFLQKTTSIKENTISNNITDYPSIVILHLHAYGDKDYGTRSNLTNLMASYLSASADSIIQFIVYSSGFRNDKDKGWRSHDATNDSVLKDKISTIYLPYRYEPNYNTEIEKLKKLLSDKIEMVNKMKLERTPLR